ncbi:hypothetical protein PBV87_22255 [Niameybacter massiliensis]|uniref:Uncharacterized protein n=1 Tax=Holtiella tumoricola TaxID=3018743 RepID=A0AA42DSJ2_9FIRM|nr:MULTISPECIES: hypothetical protein [Lachnospirales]MDA3734200.1 hypothetical protein [Holtiella tumoricola]
MKTLEFYKHLLQEKGIELEAGVLKNEEHYFTKLYVAHKLESVDCNEEAYEILRGLYEKSAVRYDRHLFASYEDYLEEKVKYFVSLANLSYSLTGEAAKSLPYLDEALITLDGEESAYPYIDRDEIEKLRDHYRSLVG